MVDRARTQLMRKMADDSVMYGAALKTAESFGVEYFSFYYFWFTQSREGGSTQ